MVDRLFYPYSILSLAISAYAFPRAPLAHQAYIYSSVFLLALMYRPLRWKLGLTAVQKAELLLGSCLVGVERCVPFIVFFVIFCNARTRVGKIYELEKD